MKITKAAIVAMENVVKETLRRVFYKGLHIHKNDDKNWRKGVMTIIINSYTIMTMVFNLYH